ncbi:MAG: transposase [Thermoplasmata archaeon]|nr:MAG: transposase [Thermoplasmata archaeon]
MTKAERIKIAILQTKEKRRQQIARVYQLKLQNLSKNDKEKLNRLFLEAKWLYNYIITNVEDHLDDNAWKLREVEIKTPKGIEKREIKTLSSQMRQSIVDRIKQNLLALKKAKQKGIKVGKLNFVSNVKSIPLKQFNITYKIDREKNRVKLQRIKKKFRILGLTQIPEDADFSNAMLIKKPSGFYIFVTCYIPKEKATKEIKDKQTTQPLGVDLGIKHQLTLSTGQKFSWYIPETKRLKKLQKTLSRKQKNSVNYLRIKAKIEKEWERICNRRKDILNKTVAYLKHFSFIAVQNDSVKSWHSGWYGKQVQNTGVGGITARLKRLATLMPVVFIDRFEPTTQICSSCRHRQKLSLSERMFRCPKCGLIMDRDVNAAKNILKKALADCFKSALPVDCGEVTPVERKTSASRFMGCKPGLCEAGSPSL